MFLTKSSTPVIGWFAVIMGFIMNMIFNVQSAIGLDNIGLCIILFTIVIYLLMTPLTIQQQKFSKLQTKMNPELQAVQKKYKGKNSDQAAMMKMNEETQAIYAKYGVNPMGSCLQMIIQLPVLFALYRVIWNIPAYVDKVKGAFLPLANELMSTSGAESYLAETAKKVAVSFKEMNVNTIIDVLYKFKPANWTALTEQFPSLSSIIDEAQSKIDHMNYFLGLNIADSPMNIIRSAFESKAFLIMILAALIPILAAVTQWLNAKLMTTGQEDNNNKSSSNGNGSSTADSMAATMKTMNNVMPLMSAVFCLTLPVGLGLYWIVGAVVRSVQQVVINKKIDALDMDELIKQNLDKLNKKREKKGLPPQKMVNNANLTTRNIDPNTNVATTKNYKASSKEELSRKAAQIGDNVSQKTSSGAKKGSLASKALMVKEYNETHGKK